MKLLREVVTVRFLRCIIMHNNLIVKLHPKVLCRGVSRVCMTCVSLVCTSCVLRSSCVRGLLTVVHTIRDSFSCVHEVCFPCVVLVVLFFCARIVFCSRVCTVCFMVCAKVVFLSRVCTGCVSLLFRSLEHRLSWEENTCVRGLRLETTYGR